jgi:predicted RNase H-like HicB family nuclease
VNVAGEGFMLQKTIKALIRAREEFGYAAECLEISVVTQGQTLDEVTRNLCEAVELHLADEDLEALGLSADPIIIVTMELSPSHA